MSAFQKLIGIYNAKGSLIGELQYFFGKIRGTAHCALCDITHGKLKEKKDFKQCKQDLEIPLELLHLDELEPELEKFANEAPCIIGKNEEEFVLIIDSDELEKCKSSVDSFSNLLNSKIN
tara:strand:- start:4017 stop:4376 length:360 start_codon:yes stop_codon:yes gene_type:complete